MCGGLDELGKEVGMWESGWVLYHPSFPSIPRSYPILPVNPHEVDRRKEG